MKHCSECNKPTEALFRSALVPDEVCEACFNRLADHAVRAIQEQCNPVGDKTPLQQQAVTTDIVEPAVKEYVR
jgi:hypothetical protein